MKDRRSFLKLASFAGLAAPLFPLLRTWRAKPAGKFHIVNGWILTDADLEHIRKHAA
jgi:hypothetical protein